MSTPQKSQGGNEGGGLGGLGHLGPLVTISSPSVIFKPLVAAQPPQPPSAYVAAAAPSHQHQQRPNPQTQQDPSRSVQPMYTVVDGDTITSLPYPHPTAPRPVVLAAALQPPTPWLPGSPRRKPPPAVQRVIWAPPSQAAAVGKRGPKIGRPAATGPSSAPMLVQPMRILPPRGRHHATQQKSKNKG